MAAHETGKRESSKKRKKIVEQIADDKAFEIIDDLDFVRERNLDRVFHVVRDPRDLRIIVSMTVMENIPNFDEVVNPPQ